MCERGVCVGGDKVRCVDGEVGGGEQPGDGGSWWWYRRWRAGEGGESIALKSEEVGLGQPPP